MSVFETTPDANPEWFSFSARPFGLAEGRPLLQNLGWDEANRPGTRNPRENVKQRRIAPGALLISMMAVLVALGTGCGLSEAPADLVIINGPEPETLDPGILTGQADGRVALALFEGLTRFNPTNAVAIPGVAERWTISPDGLQYTFHIRQNAVWSTGEPITAHDVVYSWMRILEPSTAADYVGLLFYIRGAEDYHTGKARDPGAVGIRAVDDRTLHVELKDPTPFFLELCAQPTLVVVPRMAIERDPAHKDRWLMERPLPVSGAYQLDYWRVNDRIRLRKNPRHWDAANTRCGIVDLLPCTSAATALNLYMTGGADIVWDKELAPTELLDILTKRKDFHRFDYLGVYFIRFNVTRRPFEDARVRKALALAIDKRRLVEKITRAGEKVARHLVPSGIENYTSPAGLGYDPDRARRLLAEAGFPGGAGFPRMEYLFNTQKTHEKIAVELQDMWRAELGIQVELRPLEWKVFLVEQSKVQFDMSRSSWIGDYNDPNTFLDLFMSSNGNNRTGWKHPTYDELMRRGNSETDPIRRATTLQAAERLLVEDEVPIIPLYFYSGLEYFDPSTIGGIHFNLRAEHPIWAIHKKRP